MFLQRVLAEVSSNVTDPLGNRAEQITSLSQVFGLILNIVLGVGWALVVIMLAMGFVQYVISQGEKIKIEQAQKWLTYAVIGGVGLFFVMVIRVIMGGILGGNITINTITNLGG